MFGSAILKRCAEDFIVDELMDIEPDGQGEHLWLHVEKRGLDTESVRRALVAAFGVADRDVGHAGLKDRHAVTRQWMSVRVPAGVDEVAALDSALDSTRDSALDGADAGSFSVLSSSRHSRKLRIGAHRGNGFRIRLHDVCGDDGAPLSVAVLSASLAQRVRDLQAAGFPNRFGAQRFGAGGRNVDAARAMFSQRSRRLSRTRRGLLLSAARSHLFNRVLDARVVAGTWSTLLPGEPAMLAGSRSMFLPAADDHDIDARLRAMDVSPTGPMPGQGETLVTGDCAEFERAVLADEAMLCAGLAGAGVDAARRALRVPLPDLQATVVAGPDGPTIEFGFSLPPGSYATSLLDCFGRTVPPTSPPVSADP